MRNLKKILAMVLALVMSLSLMATAGAAQFPDVDDSNPYKTAIDVLDELKVFQGFEDGTFKPTDTLNRAQAAVLVYRIATGDVENKYLDNYTYMQQSKFNDLDGYNWAKGYINYCQNAGIVVGTSATTFNPGAPVTGYQLMVMLLRTLGYGKAGEFTDPKGWELQTAAIAEREGILKNVTGGDFGAPAPRQMVAEILFRGLLHDTVEYSPLTPGGYTNSGETLGKRELGLEDISGVVMANEWADLESGSVLAEGKTRLDVNGTDYNLDISSALTDVGELRHAYVQNGTKVLTSLEDAGGNTVKDSKDLERRGEGIKVDKLRGDVKLDENTEYFLNFGEQVQDESEWRIEYNVKFERSVENNLTAAQVKAQFEKDYCELVDDAGMKEISSTEYTKSIKPGTKITEDDLAVIRGIFDLADGDTGSGAEGGINRGVRGSVYAGANSQSHANRNKNLAVEMTYSNFVREYINNENVSIKDSDNGEWLKVIDNDGDGVAEYVLRTDFTMTTITDWSSKTEKWDFESEKNVKNGDIKLVEDTSELAVGDVILYTWIDGVCHVSKPEPIEMTVAKKGIDYKNETLTGTDETVYDWSGIERKADSLYDDVSYAVAGVTYDLYQDYFGFTRLYKESDGGLVLLTDGYFATDRRNDEFKAQIWNGEFNDVDVVGGADDFISDAVNKESGNVTIGNFTGNSDDEGTWKRLYRFNATYYDGTAFTEHSWIAPAETPIQAKVPNNDHYTYNTNIASYIMNADGAYSLSLARDHRENARTHYNSFAIDVTNYEVKAKDQVLWGIEAIDANDKITATQRINTTTETVYYLVEGTGKDMEVTTWTGYNNAPSNYTVERAYAVTSYVADNTRDKWNNALPYEVAEVVVIESTKDTGVPNAYLGISLEQKLFGNNQIGLNGLGLHDDTWGLDTVTMKPGTQKESTLAVLPENDSKWPNETADMMRFYYADSDGEAVRIDKNFDYYRIYAGRVVTSPYVEGRNYIQITKDGSTNATQKNSFFFPHDIDTSYNVTYDAANHMRTRYDVDYTHDFDIDDMVVYMVDGDGNVGFVVNVNKSVYGEDDDIVPGLKELWKEINVDYAGSGTAKVRFFGQDVDAKTKTLAVDYAKAKAFVEANPNADIIEISGSDSWILTDGNDVLKTEAELVLSGATWKVRIGDDVYTLIQRGAAHNMFANLVSTEQMDVVWNRVATINAQGAAAIRLSNRDILVTNLIFKTDADWCEVVDVVGCDANGTENLNLTAATCDHILVTLRTSDGMEQTVKVQVLLPDEQPLASYTLDIDEAVTTYLWKGTEPTWDWNVNAHDAWTEGSISSYDMSGYDLLFIADRPGTLTVTGIKPDGTVDSSYPVAAVKDSFSNGTTYTVGGVATGVACLKIPAVTMDIKVTFTPDPTAVPVDGEITKLNLHHGGLHSEYGFAWQETDGDDVVIVVADESALPAEGDRSVDVVKKWFGLNKDGTSIGTSSAITGVLGVEEIEDVPSEYAMGYTVIARGANGGEDATKDVYFKVYDDDAYIVSFWGGNGTEGRNNIQFTLSDIEGTQLTLDELNALGITSAEITVGNTTKTINKDDSVSDTISGHTDIMNGKSIATTTFNPQGAGVLVYAGAHSAIGTDPLIPAGTTTQYHQDGWNEPTSSTGTVVSIKLFADDTEIKIVATNGKLN